MRMCAIDLILPMERIGEFKRFLILHRRVKRFRSNGNSFSLRMHGNNEEMKIFVQGIQDIFEVEFRCNGTCRDGTACLNRRKFGTFCWKHKD